MIEKIKFQRFTAFEDLKIDFSPGINIFIGENATGKTHIMKAVYAACDITKSKIGFAEKINNVFFPSGKQIGRLVKRTSVSSTGFLEIFRRVQGGKTASLRISLSNHTTKPEKAKISGSPRLWTETPIEAAYIPVKDMMANAPGFRSLYEEREIHFEEIYVDIIRKAFLPILKGPTDKIRKDLLKILQDAMEGKVIQKNEEFFLKSKRGELEFTLLAEGYRKMGLLWLLIQNGTLLKGSVLLWDEPETNLNPRLMEKVVGILLKLQRMGVQVFLATHDYVLLKEFDLQADKNDKIIFHSLYRDQETREIEVSSTDQYLNISPNAIDDTFGSIVDRDIKKSMGGLGK
ncbi:MAG: AAA family ATPase [Deltaproteobacteria bacterium]|nr:AAA family ATPase [Deltaproteobacteria bacterium]